MGAGRVPSRIYGRARGGERGICVPLFYRYGAGRVCAAFSGRVCAYRAWAGRALHLFLIWRGAHPPWARRGMGLGRDVYPSYGRSWRGMAAPFAVRARRIQKERRAPFFGGAPPLLTAGMRPVRYRISSRRVVGRASCFLGRWSLSTPSVYSAVICSVCTPVTSKLRL